MVTASVALPEEAQMEPRKTVTTAFAAATPEQVVAGDMAAIFGPLPPHGRNGGWSGDNADVVSFRRPASSGLSAHAATGLIALTALVGIFAGIVLNGGAHHQTLTRGDLTLPTVSPSGAGPPFPSEPRALSGQAAAASIALPLPVSPLLSSELPSPSVRLRRSGGPEQLSVPAAPIRVTEARLGRSPHRLAPRRIPLRRKATPAVAHCRTGSSNSRQWCAHQAVMAADRQLRRAYGRASQAGVSDRTLVAYGDRWARLLDHATDQPGRTVAGYGALTRDLDSMAEHVGDSRNPRAERPAAAHGQHPLAP